MKKPLSLLLALMMLCALCAAVADAPAAVIRVSITDATGALALPYAPVTVTDADADGALTLNDALLCAHAAYHPDGAAAFGSVASQWGRSMTRLWGAEGDSFGYCVNHQSAMSLLDAIQDGDHVKAYAFTDLIAWADVYCYFDADAVQTAAGEAVALTLYASSFDENWNPITLPVSGAAITLNGEATPFRTDAEGRAVLTLSEAGEYVVSAASDTQVLVAPVCLLTVR